MRCVITYTTGSVAQDFVGATAVLESLGEVTFDEFVTLEGRDDRVRVAA